MNLSRSRAPLNSELRRHIEEAHDHLRAAQTIAYRSTLDGRSAAPFRVRYALNRAQCTLIGMLTRHPR